MLVVSKRNIVSSKTWPRAKVSGAKDRALAAFGCCTTEYRHLVLGRCYGLKDESIDSKVENCKDVLFFNWIEEGPTAGQ